MAKKPAKAKASDGEAIPEKPKKPAPKGIPEDVWDSWAITETFEPGPDGGPSEAEQAAVDAQGEKIRAFRAKEREAAETAERENREAKLKKAEERKLAKAAVEESRWAKIEARLDALEKANG